MNEGFDSLDYKYGIKPGQYPVRLDGKSWGKKLNLRCYFTNLADGSKFWISVFADKEYHPQDGNIDFKNGVNVGDKFEILIDETRNHLPNFVSAIRSIAEPT